MSKKIDINVFIFIIVLDPQKLTKLITFSLLLGIVAGVIDIGTSWMSDLRFGICPEAFFFNKEQCCWSSNETFYDRHNCSNVSIKFL